MDGVCGQGEVVMASGCFLVAQVEELSVVVDDRENNEGEIVARPMGKVSGAGATRRLKGYWATS